jgi:probable HAF family extracellular repeat protein
MKTRIMRRTMLFTALIALGFFNAGQSVATDYVITDLGTLGGTKSDALDINNNNEVVGQAYLAGDNVYHAFLYSGGVMTDLGVDGCTYPSARTSWAFRINDSGQIAGQSCFSLPRGPTDRAFLYDAGVMTELGTLGGTGSQARGINNLGHVAGSAALAGDVFSHAFIYSGGALTDLGTLNGVSGSSWTYGMNDSDQVVGYSRYAGSSDHAFLYSGGVMADLTPTLGCCSSAYRINNAGQIVGYADFPGGHHAFLYSGGVLTDLGTLASNSEAAGINNAGVIVGYYVVGTNLSHAFLYKDGVMTDLNGMLPAGSGWVLNYAVGINDNGRIIGTGTINGQKHGFMAAPAYSGDFAPADCDVDGSDLAALISNPAQLNLTTFAGNFGKNACQ